MKNKFIYRIKDLLKNVGIKWDKLAPDIDTVTQFAHAHINSEPLKNIDINHKTLEYYLAHSGESINKIKLRIKVPAGTKCVYMGNVNDEQWYYEVDIMHSAKLKIISIDKTYINCELLTTA